MKSIHNNNSSLKRLHKIEEKESKQPKTQKWLGRGLVLGLIVGIGSGVGAVIFCLELEQRIAATTPESVSDVANYARPNTITIKAIDGTIIKQIGEVSYEKVKLEELPDTVYQAFVASEDKRFYQHQGVDIQGIARAAWVNFKAGEVVEGGSTITQQLARIVYLNQEKTFWRKLKEVEIARRIEENLDKKEILETYLNLVYLGAGSYGLGDAAWVYFGKSAEALTVAEVATLVGVIPAPSVYSPFNNPELALRQRNGVLNRMAEDGYITLEVAQAAIAAPLVTNRQQLKRLQVQAPYFTNYIEQELPKYLSEEQLQAGGIVVETTIDLSWQKAAEKTVKYGLDTYSKWQKFQQAALVSLDPRTGAIKAMVGGRDFDDNQYNRVTQAQRQPGSTFKTFVYTAAMAAGFSPNKTYPDRKFSIEDYEPRNYKEKYRRTNVSLYNALAISINTVALQTSLDVGLNPIIKIAQNMGIDSEMQATYSLALGSWEVNLLELTNAYATLANQGVYEKAHGITQIRDRHGEIIYQADFPSAKALNADTAAMMTWMLQGVVRSGTGRPAQIGRPSAGKTGTSDEARDLWYIGYIPQVTTGIWLGNDDNKPTKGFSTVAAEMWRKFMLQVVQDIPVEAFPPRPPLTGREVMISAEPIKIKPEYLTPNPRPRYRTRYTRNRPKYTPRRSRTATPVIASPRSKPVKPASSPAAIPHQPKFSKPSKTVTPAQTVERDWVKERLGRQ